MKSTYSSLRKKYENFMVPAADILVDGKNLVKDLGCKTQGVTVSLSVSEPGTASFKIWDCFDIASHSVKTGITSNILLGSKVVVKMGYGSDKTTVFIGYIDSLGLSMSSEDSFYYDVKAKDVLKLLKESGSRIRIFEEENYVDIFKTLMKPYQAYCTLSTGSMAGKIENHMRQDCTDYQFIMKHLIEGGACGWEFFVSAGVAYFREKDAEKDVVVSLSPGGGLHRFSWSFQYVNKKIQVLGYSLDVNGLVGTKVAASAGLSSNAVQGTEVVKALGAATQEEVDKRAEKVAKKLMDRGKRGSLSTIGLPQLLPGKYVEITGLDQTVNGEYYISSVTHSMSTDGYSTELGIGEEPEEDDDERKKRLKQREREREEQVQGRR